MAGTGTSETLRVIEPDRMHRYVQKTALRFVQHAHFRRHGGWGFVIVAAVVAGLLRRAQGASCPRLRARSRSAARGQRLPHRRAIGKPNSIAGAAHRLRRQPRTERSSMVGSTPTTNVTERTVAGDLRRFRDTGSWTTPSSSTVDWENLDDKKMEPRRKLHRSPGRFEGRNPYRPRRFHQQRERHSTQERAAERETICTTVQVRPSRGTRKSSEP